MERNWERSGREGVSQKYFWTNCHETKRGKTDLCCDGRRRVEDELVRRSIAGLADAVRIMEEIASLIIHSRKKILAEIFFFLDLRSLSSYEKKQHWGLDERVASLSEASKRCFVRDGGDLNIEKVRDQLTEAAFQVEMSSEALRRRRRRRQHATQTRAKKVDRQEILGPRIEEKKTDDASSFILKVFKKIRCLLLNSFQAKVFNYNFLVLFGRGITNLSSSP